MLPSTPVPTKWHFGLVVYTSFFAHPLPRYGIKLPQRSLGLNEFHEFHGLRENSRFQCDCSKKMLEFVFIKIYPDVDVRVD